METAFQFSKHRIRFEIRVEWLSDSNFLFNYIKYPMCATKEQVEFISALQAKLSLPTKIQYRKPTQC